MLGHMHLSLHKSTTTTKCKWYSLSHFANFYTFYILSIQTGDSRQVHSSIIVNDFKINHGNKGVFLKRHTSAVKNHNHIKFKSFFFYILETLFWVKYSPLFNSLVKNHTFNVRYCLITKFAYKLGG